LQHRHFGAHQQPAGREWNPEQEYLALSRHGSWQGHGSSKTELKTLTTKHAKHTKIF